MKRTLTILGLVLVALLSLVSAAGAQGQRATGTFVSGTGAQIGTAELTQEANQVRVIVRLNDASVVTPGNHGFHFHAVGRCDGPDFMSAGGHFNPTSKQHGLKNPAGPHAGDLPNLPIDATTRNQTGSGYTFVTTTNIVTLTPGASSLFDADGTALVIHANPDDEVTDPTGNSGGRIACAVLRMEAGTPGLPSTGQGGMAGQTMLQAALVALAGLVLGGAAATIARRRA